MQYLVYLIIVVVLAYALQPKAQNKKPPTLDELDIPTAEEGKPIPVVFGTWIVKSPNIVWYGDLGYTKIKSSGGK